MKAHKTPRLTLRTLLSSKWFRINLAAFVGFNIILYGWIMLAHQRVSFDVEHYAPSLHHYVSDGRASGATQVSLLHSLAAYDTQWYLRIANHGYPKLPAPLSKAQIYAFPPLYPLAIAATHIVFRDYLLSAFVLTQIILICNFTAICWLVGRWYSERLAYKVAWLVFLYPGSVFYRTYYSEGLFLLLMLIFLDALRTTKWGRAAMTAGLLAITRIIGIAAIVTLIWQLIVKKGVLRRREVLGYVALSCVPLILFSVYCFVRADNPLQYMVAQQSWTKIHFYFPGSATLWSIAHFFSLDWHEYHSSRIDVLSIVLAGGLLFASRTWLPKSWWRFALILWLIPILTTDTVSAARFQVVNFPLFLYAAHVLKGKYYGLVATLSLGGLLFALLWFVNWHWVG